MSCNERVSNEELDLLRSKLTCVTNPIMTRAPNFNEPESWEELWLRKQRDVSGRRVTFEI